jgi:molecular chaperone GrpE
MPEHDPATPRRTSHRRTRTEERIEELDVSPAVLAGQLDALGAERDAAIAKADEYLAALQRERAEFQNYKRRTSEERERELGLAGVDLITKVLSVADDFDRAIEARPDRLEGDAWADGIAAIDRKLSQLLASEGVTVILAAPGTAFDPREHEAITTVPGSAFSEGLIVEEIRRGYRLRDRVIRPALVAVADGGSTSDPSAGPFTN